MTKEEKILVLFDLYNHRPMSWPKFCRSNELPYTEPLTYVQTDCAPSFNKLRDLIRAFEKIQQLPAVAQLYRQRVMDGDEALYRRENYNRNQKLKSERKKKQYEGTFIDPVKLEEFKNRYFKIKALHPFYQSDQKQYKHKNKEADGNHQNN